MIWQIVFWILLIPLIVVEFVLFLRTRRFSWLAYGVAIFTYVIAITYTIDVFTLGKNAVILTLLASSALMVLIGRRLRTPAFRAKPLVTSASILFGLLIILFVISAVFGKVQETVQPVQTLTAAQVAIIGDEAQKMQRMQEVTVLTRTLTNTFFLPVPVPQHNYLGCLRTSMGTQTLYPYTTYEEHPEVSPHNTKQLPGNMQRAYLTKEEQPIELLLYDYGSKNVYEQTSPSGTCDFSIEPMARITIE